MLGNSRIHGVAAAAAVALAVSMGGGAVAAAAPGSSTGSAVIDMGADLGSSVLDLGSSVLGGSSGYGAPTQQCNQSTKSGGAGVTETNHQLGTTGPTSFVLTYETLNVPDRIQVFYQGGQIADTGYVGDNRNEGTGSVVVSVPPGTASSVLVRVTGPSNTQWSYTVHCPS